MRDKKHGNVGFTAARAQERSMWSPCNIFATLIQKVLCQAHLTFEAQGDLLRCTNMNENRAETQGSYRRDIPREKEYAPNIKKFGIS